MSLFAAIMVLLLLFWLLVLALAFWFFNRLFPPLRRSPDERAETPLGPAPPRASGATPPPPLPRPARPPPRPAAVPGWAAGYWRASRRIIAPLLLIWLISFALPALLAPWLNQFRIAGFPLDYYMGAQGSLIIFIGLIIIYAWRMARLDRRYGLEPPPPDLAVLRYRHQMLFLCAAFGIGFISFALLLGLLEARFAIPPNVIAWIFLGVTIAIYAIIGLRAHSNNLDDYYVAGRRIPGILNGLATGSDWMSAASFISMAGALWLLGYEGLAYILGWTGGFVLLAMVLAPYLRKFGQYTIPDFIAARYQGSQARTVAAIVSIIIGFTYLTAQVTGVGIIMSRFLGVNYMLGVIVGLAAVLLCSYMGGMKAITWTQVAQGLILVLAYLVPVTWISLQLTSNPLPQLSYGTALEHIEQLEAAQNISRRYGEPFNDWSNWNFLALVLCLMFGTAGMPHILIRFYTVPTVREARSSVGWALVWISLLYFTVPAYAAFSRWEILENVVGRPVAELPAWAANWSQTGLLSIEDLNGDDILQFNELRIDQDLVVLATPEIAGLPPTVVALVAAGGLAAALSTADGLLLMMASSAAHDIYYRNLNPRASPREQLWLGRLMMLVIAVLAALTAVQRLGIIVQLVAWAFSLAAATLFPALVLGIFWKRANSRGAVAGMLSGLGVTAIYMIANYINPELNILGISHSAAGIFGLPVNILVTWLVSRSGPPPPAHVQAMVENLRYP